MDGQGESGGFSLTVDGRIAAARMPVTPGLLCENRTQDREAPAGAGHPLGERNALLMALLSKVLLRYF